MAERHEPSTCSSCGTSVLKREIPSRTGGFIGAADWDTCHHNPALGKTFRNNLEARKYAKSKGMTEMGNEPIDAIHKKYENERKAKLDYDLSSITDLGEIRTK